MKKNRQTTNNQGQPSTRTLFEQHFGRRIEDYDAIKRAVSSVGEVSKQNYYRGLPSYFLFLNQDPDEVIKQRTKDIVSNDPLAVDRYDNKTKEYARQLADKGLAGRGINSTIGRIQGFYSNNSKRLRLDLGRMKISKARKVQKYSPTNEEVRALYNRADCSRDRLIVALMYQNGLAPIDVSSLRVGDLPTQEWSYYEKSRSKTGEIWRGVVTPDIVVDLKSYLLVRGERPDNQLFYGREGVLNAGSITQIITGLIEKAGLGGQVGFKPTSLRDAFEDALVEGDINHKTKEGLMGHSGSIESEYGGANRLRVVCVEAVKKIYRLITLNGYAAVERQKADLLEVVNSLISRIERLEKRLEKSGGS
jgi:integrase